MYFLILDFIPLNLEFLTLKQRFIKLGFAKGQVVAVKVPRLGVQGAISLHILILLFMAGLIHRGGKFNTDLQVKL